MNKNENIICIEEDNLKAFVKILEDRLLTATNHLSKIDELLEVQKNLKETVKKEGRSEKVETLYSVYKTMVDLSQELDSLRGNIKFFAYQEIENIELTNQVIAEILESEIGDNAISLIKH